MRDRPFRFGRAKIVFLVIDKAMLTTIKIAPLLRTRLLPVMILVIIGIAHPSAAQFTDDFSDGNYSNNPTWTPDSPDHWTVDNFRLRSNAQTASSTFYISTPSLKVTQAQWEFFVQLQFNTSSTNFVDVYLVSENENLLAPGNNGYFVRIGGTPDEISLYKTVNGTTSILVNGMDGVTNSSNNILKIKVIRDENDLWTLSYDNTGTGNNYFSEPSITDNTFSTGNYFGIRITQSTASFFNRHFFDDVYVGDILYDTEPPTILSATPVSATELDVVFNEKVDEITSQSASNYSVNNGVGLAISAILQPDAQTVHLSFANEFPNGVTCQVTVGNVEDVAGNPISSAIAEFFFFQPVPVELKDVIFTELFPDPSPVIGLPEAEFVELHNRSLNPVNLSGWKLSDPASTATLPDYVLMPGAYITIAPVSATSAYSSLGPVLGVSNFPTLNNTADDLVLRDASNTLIDEVNYTDAWYKDDDKRQGGWTLELIDPENICAESENWVASEHPLGGTPGQQNSVKASKPDLTGPKLLSAIPVSSTQLKLVFDEKLETEIPPSGSFVITPAVVVNMVSFLNAGLREVILNLGVSIENGQTYSITVSGIRDCAGNTIQQDFNSVSFGVPEAANAVDVVINELLFNPKPFGVDFIEIYNRSNKYLNLKNWNIGNYENGTATNLRTITTDDFLLPPGSILAFTVDPLTVKSHYANANLTGLVKVNALPAFPDNDGSASIINESGLIIDSFLYTRDYHSVFLRDKEGVSLERIHADVNTNDPNNWKSAASTVGFATPGYRNSNALEAGQITGEVRIEPEIFVPLFGQPDFTEIKYNFDQGGRMANIKIIDQQGREIKRIAENELLATDGFFRWDGDRDDGAKVRPGYYVVWFEVFDASGRVDTFRKRVVVAARY
jgi:hypothetical protein